ncbi:heavy metal translocating P-type ATPase [Halarcobacter ebronensis]|uniref:Copper-transporting ATPase n=1 Tax=Halarcobacter ebronensis TaxID=1462615 RepID=A0A4Q1AED9_9BACT|nr:heavy metal translocating P-type ATPase [Halarcobacter ebronensis]QKF81231.1 cytochrome oxidase maturation protein, cbb3-type [Halarcobacter ebronensis]RXK01794.1 copper-translocating P-type ATPase [Halarcobacter ebronensis]
MADVKCNHCHLVFDEKVMIKEGELNFCCKGCQGVYHILKDDGLDSFYEKLGNKTIAPPIEVEDDVERFDTKSFEDTFIKTTENGYNKIDLIIEGIHCAACVWLNEKVLFETEGIISADINFTNNKAKIVWDNEKIKLSQIILKIRSIGYNAYAYDSTVADEQAAKSKRDYFIRMMVAVFASVNIMMLSVAKYTGFFTGIDEQIREYIHIAELVFTTPVLFYSGWIFFRGAYYGLRNRVLNMDFLVSSGATLTYIYSLYVLFGGKGESYFDSVTMIITFVLVGKYLEVIGKKSAVDTLDKIKSSIPLEATVVKDGVKKAIALNNIELGDIIEIRSGEKVCIDGKIISGEGTFDESSLTGESVPVFKKMGDTIYSGTINNDALIRYETTKTYKDSTLNSIVTLLEDSLSSKPEIEYKANEVSKGFTVSILSLSLLTFLVWYFFGLDLGFDYENTNHFEKSFIVAISVIVIACPCALALATPIASLIGISELAKKGLLFKEAKFIETMAKANTLVMDKTGTITKGELKVKKARILDDNIHKLNLLYSLLDASSHPISKSVKKYLLKKYDNLELKNIIDVKNIQAKGMVAKYTNVDDKLFHIIGGNMELIKDNRINYNFESQNSVYIFAINRRVIATFELADEIREDAKELVENLKAEGLDIVMLTGDNESVAKNVASKVGIKKVVSNIDPIGKANYIKKLREEGKIVVMAGDGINDSVALASSDVSIAMGNSADITISVSDIVLLNSSLKSLNFAFMISKRTYKFIKENLLLSLIYNMITIPLAMAGFVIPLVAALSMSLSSLLVVANSMRIKLKG